MNRTSFYLLLFFLAALISPLSSAAEVSSADSLRLAAFEADVTPPIGSPLCDGLVAPADFPYWLLVTAYLRNRRLGSSARRHAHSSPTRWSAAGGFFIVHDQTNTKYTGDITDGTGDSLDSFHEWLGNLTKEELAGYKDFKAGLETKAKELYNNKQKNNVT